MPLGRYSVRSGRDYGCQHVHRSGFRCPCPPHGDSPYCYQHDPEMAARRKRGVAFSATDSRFLRRLDELAAESAANTGLWAEPWDEVSL